jgi:hypothetical protein
VFDLGVLVDFIMGFIWCGWAALASPFFFFFLGFY